MNNVKTQKINFTCFSCYSNRYIVAFHGGFNLHFPNGSGAEGLFMCLLAT